MTGIETLLWECFKINLTPSCCIFLAAYNLWEPVGICVCSFFYICLCQLCNDLACKKEQLYLISCITPYHLLILLPSPPLFLASFSWFPLEAVNQAGSSTPHTKSSLCEQLKQVSQRYHLSVVTQIVTCQNTWATMESFTKPWEFRIRAERQVTARRCSLDKVDKVVMS